jgi:glycosyltransferase involved in cell wall biosynthesis
MAAGVDVICVVPRVWPEVGCESVLSPEMFPIVEVDVRRPGDVNRHSYIDVDAVANLAAEYRVDLVDLHEEPFSRAAGQLLPRLPADLPVVMYSAQNLDKRWPPPFLAYERRSLARVQGLYPCSLQAASVLRGKGFGGLIRHVPLGYDELLFSGGQQSVADGTCRMALVGRMVPEKGVRDAVRVLADLRGRRSVDASLVLAGAGPALDDGIRLAAELEVGDRVEARAWMAPPDLAALYQQTHVLLAPSRSTSTWAEQFGRMLLEAQASGCVVAGYDSGAIAEVAGNAAVLVEEGDVTGLATAVSRVLGDAATFETHRQRGFALARDRSWAHVADRQVRLYKDAVRRRPGPLLSGSPRQLRESAVAEFGPPAKALGQLRSFAVPGLRRPTAASSTLGQVLDWVGEAKAKLGQER